jgi:hypothetical protein
MRKVLICIAGLALAGCAEYRAKVAAERAAADDAKCQSYGAKPGEPAYVHCSAQLDAARTQAAATESVAAPAPHCCDAAPDPFPPVPPWRR